MSTNDVLAASVGESVATVFCDHRGRIVEHAHLCRTADDESFAFVSDAPGLLAWLERYHFSERIEWEDLTSATIQLELVGPDAAAICRSALSIDLDGLPTSGVRTAPDAGSVLRMGPVAAPEARLWGPTSPMESLKQQLLGHGVLEIDDHTWQILRVERGEAIAGAELSLDHNPWEAGLYGAIHKDKGCYLGQEVIARLDTYQKVKQQLVGLRLGAVADPGTEVRVEGTTVGSVTSAVHSPRWGPLALAYVRTAHCAPGTIVEVAGVDAAVAALPFDGSMPA